MVLLQYQNIKTFLQKVMFQSVREKFLLKIKNTILWTYGLSDLKGEEICGNFYQKELQKANQKEFRVEKVIKRKGNQLYVKWKYDDISFNTWIDRKRHNVNK